MMLLVEMDNAEDARIDIISKTIDNSIKLKALFCFVDLCFNVFTVLFFNEMLI